MGEGDQQVDNAAVDAGVVQFNERRGIEVEPWLGLGQHGLDDTRVDAPRGVPDPWERHCCPGVHPRLTDLVARGAKRLVILAGAAGRGRVASNLHVLPLAGGDQLQVNPRGAAG